MPYDSLVKPGDLPAEHGGEGHGTELAGQALTHHTYSNEIRILIYSINHRAIPPHYL